MKIFVVTLMIASAASAAAAQEPAKAPEPAKIFAEGARIAVAPQPPQIYETQARDYQTQAKIVAELASAYGHAQTKNSPLSADEVNESVQTLADGNRIVRSSTGKFYRNSEGRVRREGSGLTGSVLGTTFSFGQGVSIANPVGGQKYVLDSDLKTARVIEMNQGQKGIAIAGSQGGPEGVIEAKRAKELVEKLQTEAKSVVREIQVVPGTAATIVSSGQGGLAFTSAGTSKYETRNEDLGVRDFEGVSAEGTRRTTTIPAGAIGNERPIEVVYERWFSKDLGMVVYSKNTDPRFGEQTYKLTNIVRSEPDPSLFAVPTEYKKVSENGTMYRVSTGATAPRPTTAAKPVMVSAPAKAGKP